MSNLFSGISGRFTRGGSNKNGPNSPSSPTGPNGNQLPPTLNIQGPQSTSNHAPRLPAPPLSPSLSQTLALDSHEPWACYNLPRPLPLWLDNTYAKQIVKGNFMTLSARPKTVDPGEWIAHHVVEHYRNLWTFVKVIHDKEEDKSSICNPSSCPRMSAGANHSFTWLNARREPVEVAACEYVALMQRWISGKIDNTDIFPTDPAGVAAANNPNSPLPTSSTYASGGLNTPGSNTPIPAGPTTLNTPLSQLAGPGDWIGKSSGFPQEFMDVCQTIFRQMFRVYAHLYWAHFMDFYHLGCDKHLNSCFSHFILTATGHDLLRVHELEPMQPLFDLWAANETFPPQSRAYEYSNVEIGEALLAKQTPPKPQPGQATVSLNTFNS